MKEETGLDVKELKYKGNMIIEYPNRIFDFDVFLATESEGEPQEFEENTSEWIEIQELLQKEKILSNIIVLDSFFIRNFISLLFIFSCSLTNPPVKMTISGFNLFISSITLFICLLVILFL